MGIVNAKQETLFWAKVAKGPDCWEWTGAVTGGGYGKLTRDGRTVAAHRTAWELVNGPIPRGEGYHGVCVLHRCDNRRCVRPEHLFLGTQLANCRDRDTKGRINDRAGTKNGRARFTEDQVREIRSLRGRITQREVAARFGTTAARISEIQRRATWKSID